MSATEAKLVCSACGKSYPWKPQYAGRSLKCKCGAVIKAPGAAPIAAAAAPASRASVAAKPAPALATAAVSAPSSHDEFEKLLSQAEYDIAPEPEPAAPRMSTAVAPIVSVAPAGAAAAVATPTPPMLGYAGSVRKPVLDEPSRFAMLTDLFGPVLLIVLGLVAYFIDARMRGMHSPILASIYVFIEAVIDLTLVFIALLIAVKLVDLGLGPIGPAMLKVAAVALLPAAMSDMVGLYMGLVPWILSAIMYALLLYYLFELDMSEIWIVTAIIWIVQTWVAMLLIGLLIGVLGMHPAARSGRMAGSPARAPSGPGFLITGPGLSGPSAGPAANVPPPVPREELDSQLEIKDGVALEAREWLKDEQHFPPRSMKRDDLLNWVEKFYAAGAKSVLASDIHKINAVWICRGLIVQMPSARAARQAVLGVRAEMEGDLKPPADEGGKYIHIEIDLRL